MSDDVEKGCRADEAPEASKSTGAKAGNAVAGVDYNAKPQNKTNFSCYLRVFRYSSRSDRMLLAAAFIAEIGTGATLPLMQIVFGNLVGGFTTYFVPDSTTTKAEFEQSVNKQTLYIVYLFIARWILCYFSMFSFRIVGLRMSANVRLEYLKALMSLPIGVLDTLPSGQASNTITTSSNVLQIGISDKLGNFVQSTALLVTAIIIAFRFSWALTLVTSTVLIFILLVYGTLIPVILKMTKELTFADEKASSIAGEVIGAVRMIAACGAERRVGERFAGWMKEYKKRGLKMSPFVGAQFAPLYFSIYATMGLCFYFGFKLYAERHIDSVGTIVIVLMSVMILAVSVGQTAAPIIAISNAAAAATDFFVVIDAAKQSAGGLKAPDASAHTDIRLKHVTFAYPSRPHVKVLDDFSVDFEAGKITALVGASGAGKSTLVGLLERWYELDDTSSRYITEAQGNDIEDESEVADKDQSTIECRGSISLGQHSVESLDLKWWRSQIGLVQQEPFLFNDTIMNNVQYGLIGSPWEHETLEAKKELVHQACKEAFANEFIDRLPLGYETQVGDAGMKLSGGQRQRLAIARSIVKRPKILILDEATSSIDVRGERLVQAALDKISEGRTTITIAHRLSTIMKADKIVVMGKGKVVEEGTHKSLLAMPNGAYTSLVRAQKLSMDETLVEESAVLTNAKDLETSLITTSRKSPTSTEESTYRPQSFFGSFGVLLFEQTKQWPWYLVVGLASAGAAVALPAQAYIFSHVVVVIADVGDQLIKQIDHWSLMFFILAIGVGVAYFLLGLACNTISVVVTSFYRQEYFENILAKPIKFFDAEENSIGTLTGRVANDPTQLQQLLGMNMAIVLTSILSIIGCICIAFSFGWKLTLAAVLVAMPIMLFCQFFRIRFELQFEKMNQAVFAESSKFASEAIGAFRTVTSLTLEDTICERYEILLQDHVKRAFKKARFTMLGFAASDSVQLLCMALTFWYGGRLLASHEYDPIQFFIVYIAVVNGAETAGSYLSFGPNIAQAKAAANRILSFRLPKAQTERAVQHAPDAQGGVKVNFEDVFFTYPTRDTPVFTGLNLTIEKGQFAALVGASGCGKTSIVSLLERFYNPNMGQILYNGTNISDIDVCEYRRSLSLVAQEPTIFQGTIRQNVLLGVSESTAERFLHQACRDAEIHDFILSLPEGYDTEVGSKGISLSGGQKQRLAIARALIRDPSILILDEATSSLDSESEKLVQAAFERAGKGRTMLVVAHRLATVQNADVIFLLGDGKVLESGDHAELLRKRGLYYSMCQSQALH